MRKDEIVLAGLAASYGDPYTPVQVQKLFFLIDKNIPQYTDGPHFHFTPYAYGPFDINVYTAIEKLEKEGKAEIWRGPEKEKHYATTTEGRIEGERLLNALDNKAKSYIKDVSSFIRRLTFPELVATIYLAYPEMKANSVFRENK